MLNFGPILQHNFRDGVSEEALLGKTDVGLHQAKVGVPARYHQGPWVSNPGLLPPGSNKNQVNHRLSGLAVRNMDESAVLDKGRVQSSEYFVSKTGMRGKVFFFDIAISCRCRKSAGI